VHCWIQAAAAHEALKANRSHGLSCKSCSRCLQLRLWAFKAAQNKVQEQSLCCRVPRHAIGSQLPVPGAALTAASASIQLHELDAAHWRLHAQPWRFSKGTKWTSACNKYAAPPPRRKGGTCRIGRIHAATGTLCLAWLLLPAHARRHRISSCALQRIRGSSTSRPAAPQLARTPRPALPPPPRPPAPTYPTHNV
jgi:hypothetical protein